MSLVYYRLHLVAVASLSLMLAACGSSPPPAPGAAGAAQTVASKDSDPDEMDTKATIWTVLGLAKEDTKQIGPVTGRTVNPILWQAVRDTLNFVPVQSMDAVTGALTTAWYSPKDKPDERLQINAFVLSPVLTSAALAVFVKRQVRGPDGKWADAPIAREVANNLETDILYRARQLRREWYPES